MSMTAGDVNGDVHGDGGALGPSPLGLPVVTASGTEVTNAALSGDGVERPAALKLDVAGLAVVVLRFLDKPRRHRRI